MVDLIIKNGTLVIPELGLVEAAAAVDGGKVTGIGLPGSLPEGRRVIDAAGRFVLPGVIDPHVHLGISPEQFSRLAVSETKAAVIGGVTTVGCYLREAGSYLGVKDAYMETVRNGVYANMCFHIQISTDEHLAEIPAYAAAYGSTTFKFYMCGNPGIVAGSDDGFILDGFKRVAALGDRAMASIHAENEAIIDRKIREAMAAKADGGLRDWCETRPPIAEEEAVIRAARMAEEAGVRLYIVHITSEAAIKRMGLLKRENGRLYAEVTSAHLGLDVDDPIGLLAKMVPPIRGRSDVDALWQGVGENIVDTFGTDNVTRSSADKKTGEGLWGSKTGYAVLGTHLPVILHEGYHKRRLPLVSLARRASLSPAKIFGLYPRKGTIRVGSDADLVIVDLEKEQRVDPEKIGSSSDFSIFQGKTLRGWPVMTIVNGKVAAEDGRLTDEAANGSYLFREL